MISCWRQYRTRHQQFIFSVENVIQKVRLWRLTEVANRLQLRLPLLRSTFMLYLVSLVVNLIRSVRLLTAYKGLMSILCLFVGPSIPRQQLPSFVLMKSCLTLPGVLMLLCHYVARLCSDPRLLVNVCCDSESQCLEVLKLKRMEDSPRPICLINSTPLILQSLFIISINWLLQ